MTIRPYTDTDLSSVVDLFSASVHRLGAERYDEAQRNAWAPSSPDLDTWRNRLREIVTLVADDDGVLAGFIAYEPNGHINYLYTSPDHARRGVASALYRHVEEALSGVDVLFTEASLVARPFFERQGFAVVEEEHVVRHGVSLTRFVMRKVMGENALAP